MSASVKIACLIKLFIYDRITYLLNLKKYLYTVYNIITMIIREHIAASETYIPELGIVYPENPGESMRTP